MAAFLFLSAGGCIPSEGSYILLLWEWLPGPPTAALIFLLFHPTLSKEEVHKARNGILCSSQWNRWSWWMMGNFNGQFVEFLIIAADCRYQVGGCRCQSSTQFCRQPLSWNVSFLPVHHQAWKGTSFCDLPPLCWHEINMMVSRKEEEEWNSSQRLLEILHWFLATKVNIWWERQIIKQSWHRPCISHWWHGKDQWDIHWEDWGDGEMFIYPARETDMP